MKAAATGDRGVGRPVERIRRGRRRGGIGLGAASSGQVGRAEKWVVGQSLQGEAGRGLQGEAGGID